MKTSQLTVIIITLITTILLGYGLFLTSGSQADVATQLATLTPASEKSDIDTNILNSKSVAKIDALKVFSKSTTDVPQSFNRANPFQGQ